MSDFIELLSRIAPRRRVRLARALFGSAALMPSAEFLRRLGGELSAAGSDVDADGVFASDPVFFAPEIELDAVYAAALAASNDSRAVFDDRRGMLEMDGLSLDLALAYETGNGGHRLVLGYGKLSGKWSGRRFRRLSDRLRRVFGEDGDAFPAVKPCFVALGPERPGPAQTASWPAWMRRPDGASYWLPLDKADDELELLRCDKKGRPRRIGDWWRFDAARLEKA